MGSLNIKYIFIALALIVLTIKAPSQASANANNCQLQNTFPGNYLYPPSHFGASRSGGARWHAGVDFFYPQGTRVQIPQGCEIRLYSDGTVIWKSDPTGYGQYMFLDCNVGGVPLTLRYSHIAQYVTSEAAIEQGRTGIETASIPDHYHFEVLISQTPGKGTPVDPECVLGLEKGDGPNAPDAECRQCPTPPGPVDFCNNPDAVAQLISHSQKCYKGNDKNNPGGETVDPNRLRGVENQGDAGDSVGPADGEATTIYDNDHEYTEPSDNDGFSGNVDDLYPPLPEDPPIQPPPTPIPGQPTGTPNLAPPPTNPDNIPEKVSGCAADTWTAMVNQAVMETRREDLLNKRFIVKPDSVLDYSCFSRNVKDVTENAGPIFSETQQWNYRPVDLIGDQETIRLNMLEEDNDPLFSEEGYNLEKEYTMSDGTQINYRLLSTISLNMAIDSIVSKSVISYLENNFLHDFLADSATVNGADINTCNVMEKVWQASKCKNADGSGLFYTFEDLVTQDPREFPASMPCF